MEIAGKEYKVKYTLRTLVVFEGLTGRAFDSSRLRDEITLHYAAILVCDPGTELTFDKFFDALDNDKGLMATLRERMLTDMFDFDIKKEDAPNGKKKD